MNYLGVIFASLAAIFTGLHIFSFKYLKNLESKKTILVVYSSISFAVWVLSRYFLYKSSLLIDIIVVHAILTTSVLTTAFLAWYINKDQYNIYKLIIGIILLLIGVFLIDSSIQK